MSDYEDFQNSVDYLRQCGPMDDFDREMLVAADRIRELEAEVARLNERLKIDGPHPFDDDFDALDLALQRADAFQARVRELEIPAQIAADIRIKMQALETLPEKWRQDANETIELFADPDKHAAIFACADELDALLKEGAL